MRIAARLLASAVIALGWACSATTNTGPAPGSANNLCTHDFSGTWTLTGSCLLHSCEFNQSKCIITVDCHADGRKLTAFVDEADHAKLSGIVQEVMEIHCEVQFGGSSPSMVCSAGATTCSGTCERGACGSVRPDKG